MSEQNDLTSTLVQVARLYYHEHMSQQQIAERLGVSRSLIALYISRARDQGIVRIEIVDPHGEREILASELRDKFGLKSVTVVSAARDSDLLTRRSLGEAAARFLERDLKNGDVLGVGWGRTLIEMIRLLNPGSAYQIDVVPLMGERMNMGSFTQINQMVLQASERFKATPHFLMAPMFVGTRQLHDALRDDTNVRDVRAYWRKITHACVGIGQLPPTPGQVVYIGDENLPQLEDKGVVGDICARYFDRKGRLVSFPFNKYLLAIEVQQLRRTPTVMAMAGGVAKTTAVLGAIRTGIVSHLFVDDALARSLLHVFSNGE